MTLDLDNLRKLEATATPGPWEYGTATCCPDMGWVDGPAGKGKVCPQYQGTKTTHTLDANDAELIAEMRNALPALLADHARLTAEVARLRAFKLHVAGCYNSWANGGDLDPHAAVAALEAIGDELGEPFAECDRG